MSKETVESYLKISTQALKKHGFLDEGYTYERNIYWGDGENRPSISIKTNLSENNRFLVFNYTHTSRWNDEKTDLEYRVLLETTNCYFGGFRYWFSCPNCFKRVGCLYGGKYFLCRSCHDLSYNSCNKSKNNYFYLGKMFDSEERAERLYKNKRWQTMYNGNYTKRYLKYSWLNRQSNFNASLWLKNNNLNTP